jgi:hypothetical protein
MTMPARKRIRVWPIFLPETESFAPGETSKGAEEQQPRGALPRQTRKDQGKSHLIEEVFRELRAKSPNGVRYLVLKLK